MTTGEVMSADDSDFTEDNVAWLALQADPVPAAPPRPFGARFVADGEPDDFTESNFDWLALQAPMVPWMTFGP
jgi:hypothetical protein